VSQHTCNFPPPFFFAFAVRLLKKSRTRLASRQLPTPGPSRVSSCKSFAICLDFLRCAKVVHSFFRDGFCILVLNECGRSDALSGNIAHTISLHGIVTERHYGGETWLPCPQKARFPRVKLVAEYVKDWSAFRTTGNILFGVDGTVDCLSSRRRFVTGLQSGKKTERRMLFEMFA
jgi:hypothetical protein